MMLQEYNPSVYDVNDITRAKEIILTPSGKLTTNDRWKIETPYLLSLIEQIFDLNAQSVVLDYGCGIGRMSKALIDKYGCRVVGVDTSPGMRALAYAYVDSDRFICLPPHDLVSGCDWADAALAIWVLQHCNDVAK